MLLQNVHTHLFRHGYAINFLNYSGRLDASREHLGHRDINAIRTYLRLPEGDVHQDLAKVQL